MSTLSWVSQQGQLATLSKGSLSSVTLSVNESNPNNTPTFTLVSGSLPSGMTLNGATGVISGVPDYSQNNNYSSTFEILVADGVSSIIGDFSIAVINPPQLEWITPLGSLANLGIGLPISIKVQAFDSANNGATLTYQVISGSLPPGMTMSSTGIISGTPTYSSPSNNYFTTLSYNFIVRVSGSDNTKPIDGAFAIILTNTVNSDLTWVTPPGDLGTVPNGEFYQLPLQVETTTANTTVTFTFVSGELPPGMGVVATGSLQGVPTLLNAVQVDTAETFRFTIRATTNFGHIRDQAFSLSVTNVYGPVIEPATTLLGSFFDGTYYSQQLSVNELNPNVAITWSNIGSLPSGVTLSSTGLLSGYIQPLQLIGAFGPAGYDSNIPAPGANNEILDAAEYDLGPYDFNQLNQTLSYNFTIQAYDGANYDLQTYIIDVVSRSGYTTDNGNITVDNTYLTTDTINTYIPVILNGNVTTLPTARSGSYYAYKFEGMDFQGDVITYSLSNTSGTFDAYVYGLDAGLDYQGDDITHIGGVGFDSSGSGSGSTTNLPGLLLDASTGWLYGKLTTQSSSYENYSFGVQVSKIRGNVTYASNPIYFNLPVLGDINNIIQWNSPENLGTVNNGQVSEIVLTATSVEGKPLVYTLVDAPGVPIRLPQGLSLLPSGEISGRVTFEAFCLDDFATTIDGNTESFDRVYNFTVQVSTTDGTATAVREFTLTLDIIDIEPYDNLYLQAMLKWDQRQIFNSVVNNTEIFVPELIYRIDDPWFGIAKDIEMLFLPGLKPSDLLTYANAMAKNHYTKNFKFGDIKTAVVLDSNYNVKYEVVYIDIVDPTLNSNGNGAELEIDLTNTITNPYIDATGAEYKIVYPDSSQNMISRLTTGVGYYDQSSLPPWMTSNQPGTTNGTFSTPLGYVQASVLAYTVPGASKLIAYRLQNSGINFNNIDFTVDRYFLDDFYTSNFNTTTDQYTLGKETTFDALPNSNIGALVASVNYAVTVPFSQINGRTVEYIIANGGIDGITTFGTGDTLIFAKQEKFLDPGPYDGWVDYMDAWIGNNTTTTRIEGYDSESYDTYTLIPGYLEKSQGLAPVNQRGGIWQITVVNDVVQLNFIQEITPGDRIRVFFGVTYGTAIVYYDQILSPGQTVPFYAVYKYQANSVAKKTTFNGDTTKFFNYRDSYYTPGSQDKYLKFPQYGVFN